MIYAGIDIGSTNTKILTVDGHGDVVMMSSWPTPKVKINGIVYFDLAKLDDLVDSMMETSKANAVAFSSVGESVVPIKDGKAMVNPVFWDQKEASATEEERRRINAIATYSELGIIPNGLLSIDKILWYNRTLPERPDFFLPICHYEVYRKTGCAFYDYSEASRSGAYNVFSQTWIDELYRELNIQPFVPLKLIGSFVSESNKVVYALGGHDHVLGLYGVSRIFDDRDIIYDSMGTSSTISLLVKNSSTLEGSKTYDRRGGGIVNGFEKDQYIVFRGLNRYGSVLNYFLKTIGYSATFEDISLINEEIKRKKKFNLAFELDIGGNFTSSNIEFGKCNVSNLNLMADAPDVVMSAYHYLARRSSLVHDNLLNFVDSKPSYIAGGLAVKNEILMKMKAIYLKEEIIPFDITEVSAFGALCASINGRGDNKVFKVLQERMGHSRPIKPEKDDEYLSCFT